MKKKHYTMREIILGLYFYYNKDWMKIYNHIAKKETFTEEMYNTIKDRDCHNLITLVDADYPDELKNVLYPPFVIEFKENEGEA